MKSQWPRTIQSHVGGAVPVLPLRTIVQYNRKSALDVINPGKLGGTVKVLGVPQENADVILFTEEDDEIVSRTKTNVNGEFVFEGLNRNVQFYVLAKVAGGQWNHITSCFRMPG